MDFYRLNNQGRFWIQRVDDINLIGHSAADERRLVYSRSDERVYIGTSTEWRILAIEYSVMGAGVKMLFGSYPLPVGWNIKAHNDMMVIVTNDSNLIGNEEGSWMITGMADSQSHDHSGWTAYATASVGIKRYRPPYNLTIPVPAHRHTIVSDGIHTHSFNASWRPEFINFVEGELQ